MNTATHMKEAVVTPGRGTWELDGAHFPRPVSPIVARLYPIYFPLGFAEDAERNGLLLDHLAYAEHGGFMYHQPRIVGAPAGAPPPPKLLLQLVSRLHPKMRSRTRTAARRHELKPWRAAWHEWLGTFKPRQLAAHRALLDEELTQRDDASLVDHLRRAVACYADAVRNHGRFTVSSQVVAGELLVKLSDWAGIAAEEVLAAVQSFSPISAGDEPVTNDLVTAIERDDWAKRTLEADRDPGSVLADLGAGAGEVARALRDYLDVVGQRTLNLYDVAEPRTLEVPFLVVEGLRARLFGRNRRDELRADRALEGLMDRVSPVHHDELRYLVEEARATSPLRDERVLYGDYWSAGVTRRALLEVGRRLAQRGVLADAAHAVQLDEAEAAGLLGVATPEPRIVTRAEVEARVVRRTRASLEDAPAVLGPPLSAPPPAAWLPQGIRMSYRIALACLAANFAERHERGEGDVVRGLAVSAGVYEGTARVVMGPDDFHRLRPGDVLVARSTSPTYNVILPMIGALITDRGGALSHAAIVSREFGIPGLVGCRTATTQLRDGVRVKVDGTSGEARVIA